MIGTFITVLRIMQIGVQLEMSSKPIVNVRRNFNFVMLGTLWKRFDGFYLRPYF